VALGTFCVQLNRLLRSSPLRLAIAYVALFGSSALLLVAFFYWSTAGFMIRQADEATEAEIAGLAERYRIAGIAGLSSLIEERLARQPSGSSLYLVTDSNFIPLVGNLSGWPQVSADKDGWLNFRLNPRQGEPVHWARAKSFRLRGGFHLLAGRDMHELQSIRSMIIRNIVWGLVLTMVLALVGAVLVARGRIRRIAEINEAIGQVVAGDLSRRIPADTADDDIEQLVENLNRMLGELETLVDGVRRVSDNIAHDLRTPLAKLKNRLELLRQGEGDDERRLIAEQAVEEADGLLSTFNALLRIARIEAGKQRHGFQTVNLTALVDDVGELYGPLFDEAGISLEIERPDRATIHGDRDLLFQAVANLVDNTLKYVPAGGGVSISLISDAAGVRLIVADDGPGIPDTEKDKVLERFYRLDTSRSTPGAGLGLSLVAAVADLHHAHLLLADNDPGLWVELDFPVEG
jgi:signal transduction histidine kinase